MRQHSPRYSGIRAIILSLGLSVILGIPMMVLVSAQDADVEAGRAIHTKQCARCHGPEGKGDGPAGKILKPKPADWSDEVRMGALADEDLHKVVKEGGKASGKSAMMPSFSSKLSDAEIGQLVAYIKSLRQ